MKKHFLGMFFFLSLFSIDSMLLCQAVEVTDVDAVAAPLVDNSGSDRIINIMSQIKHNIVPDVAEPIVYAQVASINQDLNIKEIVNFFAPKTIMGAAFLQETLQRPVSPKDQSGIVQLRQNIITELVKNSDFKQQVDAILNNAAQQEEVAKELMSNTFKGQTCPELEGLKLLKEQKHPLYGYAHFMNTNPTAKTINTTMNCIGCPLNAYLTYYLGAAAVQCYKAGLGLNYNNIAVWSVYSGFMTSIVGYVVYDDFTKAGQKRVKMHALNQLIHGAEDIEELCKNFNMPTQFKMSLITDHEGVALVDGLKYSRYENETDYCFNVPAVHTFLYKVYENDAQLAQIFASIAEMDACNAIATKMLESQASHRKFCFATAIQAVQPQAIATSFWNVLVPNAVVNSLPMNQHVILTGPNAGGKTTSIRAMLQNIVLAQTYGVAAAESFEYTPFDVLLSYLNISDDLINGYSLFASEIKRAKDLLEIIRALDPSQKLFFALDELFTGTAAEQGEKCAYEFIKKTASFDQTLFIYATHFDKLKELGKQNIGLMNYKVNAPTKNDAGKLVYPFTLSAGASNVNIAEDMAKEAGLFE